MFTGIVKSIGRLVDMSQSGAARELSFETGGLDTAGWRVGDSICVAGVCLTMERISPGRFSASVSPETLGRTALGVLVRGAPVNLEPALVVGDPLGGHHVTGHVDGVARVASTAEDAGSLAIALDAPAGLARFIAPRGSVALDGVSLTVNTATDCRFRVTVIPHTRRVTTLGGIRAGDGLNLEVDLVARYLARLVDAQGGK
jgi:riboflavin synthase